MRYSGPHTDYEPVAPSRRAQPLEAEETFTGAPPFAGTDGAGATAPPGAKGRAARPHPSAASPVEKWSFRRGHALTYVALFLYALIAYFRPYELSPIFFWTEWMPFWLAVVMLAIYVPSQVALEGTPTARTREVNFVLLLAVLAALSIPLSPSPADAWEMFYNVFIKTVLVFIVLINSARTERRLKGMIFLAFAAGFYMSFVALRDYTGEQAVEGYRAKAAIKNMFGEPNSMALHLVTMIPLAVALFLSSKGPLKKVLYGFGAALMVAGTFATQSRGGFLGLVAAGGVMAWKFGRRNRLPVMALVVVLVVASSVLAPGGYGKRMLTIFSPNLDATGSAHARRDLFWRSVTVAVYNPVFGIGIGNFPIVGIRGQVSHNAFTQVAAEIGFPAFVLYMMFMIVPLKRLRQMERETRAGPHSTRFYYLAVGLQAGLAGYMVNSFFLSVAYDWNVYFLVGYAVCLRRIYAASVGAPGSAGVQRLPGGAAGESSGGGPAFLHEVEAGRLPSRA